MFTTSTLAACAVFYSLLAAPANEYPHGAQQEAEERVRRIVVLSGDRLLEVDKKVNVLFAALKKNENAYYDFLEVAPEACENVQ